MTSKAIIVPPDVADLLVRMTPQDVALLILKILYPDKPLHELAQDVWPGVKGAMRRKRIHASGVSYAINTIAQHPYQLALILTSKIMPLAIATLYQGLAADKENVRVSAAKELIRFAQSTAGKLNQEDKALPTDELDNALEKAVDADFKVIDEDGDGESDNTGD